MESPYGCETLRLPHFLNSRLINGGGVVNLARRPLFIAQRRFLVLICVRSSVYPRAVVWLEGLGQLKIQ
jgi:hypothetical protein